MLTDIADGSYSVRFEAKDRAGLKGESESGLLRIDRTPPVVQAVAVQESSETPTDSDEESPAATPTPSSRGLFSGPVNITIEAEDATSGVWGVAYVLNDGPVVLYSEPFQISEDGIHHIRYWAKDNAGNYTSSHRLRIWMRTSAGTLSLSEKVFLPGVLISESE